MTELQDHSPNPLGALCQGSVPGPTARKRTGIGEVSSMTEFDTR